jgi:uncharacterized protein (UPF0264 family)
MFDGGDRALELIRAVVKAVKTDFPQKYVVIAAYSDYERLGTISPFALSPLAAKGGADLVMVDTGKKDGKSTFAFMNERELAGFIKANASLGMRTALAGALKFEDLPSLKRINPDVIGVRGMVCGGDRNATIREELVEQTLRMIR